MNQTFLHVVDIDCWLPSVAPYHFACLTEVLLIIGKNNGVVERCDSATAGGKRQVGGPSPRSWVGVRGGHADSAAASVASS